MIDTGLFVSFVVVSAALIAIPGPNVMLIIATALAHGRVRGLQAALGGQTAMAIQLFVAAKGTALLAEMLADAFVVLKWLGVAYLVFLGVQRLRAALASGEPPAIRAVTGSGSFGRGFVVGITNPKTILFFGAFLPQFTSTALPVEPQIAVLSATFLAIALVLDGLYALVADKASSVVQSARGRRRLDGGAGVLLVGSGVGLALTSRS